MDVTTNIPEVVAEVRARAGATSTEVREALARVTASKWSWVG
jgi:hypothetical protein